MAKPLTILLGEEIYQHADIVAALVSAGHTVKQINLEEDHLIFSTRAWRVPGDGKRMPDDEILKHLDIAIKQTRAIWYVQDKKAETQQEVPAAPTKSPAKRKGRPAKQPAKPASEADTTTNTGNQQ